MRSLFYGIIACMGTVLGALIGFGIILGYLLFSNPSNAQDHHHPLHENFYRHWKQPGSELSCCNARIEVDGIERGDCEPTDFKLIAGRWYARLPHNGPYIEVPESKIIREVNPTQDGSNGHLCYTEASGIMCAVPPFGGG